MIETDRRLFDKKTLLVIFLLLLIAVLTVFFTSREEGKIVEVWVNSSPFITKRLNEEFSLSLDNGVEIIGNGKAVYFSHSDCRDKVCINSGKLSLSGQWAACLPNKTIIKILKGNGVDVVN